MRLDIKQITNLVEKLNLNKEQESLTELKEKKMSVEQIRQKASETHKAAKALQRDLQTITDPNERKQMTKQMMELFVQSRSLKREANYRYFMERSIERDFRCMGTDLED